MPNSEREGDETQEAQKAQEEHAFLVPFVLLVFRPLLPPILITELASQVLGLDR